MHADSSRAGEGTNFDDKLQSTPIKGEMHENTIPRKEKGSICFH